MRHELKVKASYANVRIKLQIRVFCLTDIYTQTHLNSKTDQSFQSSQILNKLKLTNA